MLDSIVTYGEGKASARKCISGADKFIPGHYPGNPIFPGVLSLDLMTLVCESLMKENFPDKQPQITAMEKIRYSAPLFPGDVVDVTAEIKEASDQKVVVVSTIQGNGDRKAFCTFHVLLECECPNYRGQCEDN